MLASKLKAVAEKAHRASLDTSRTVERDQLERTITLCEVCLNTYGDGDVQILCAPARLNILGEHVDYVSYLPAASLPCASREYYMLMLIRARKDPVVRGCSTLDNMNSFEFNLSNLPIATSTLSADEEWLRTLYIARPKSHDWSNYVIGAASHARIKFGNQVRNGFDLVLDSRIPAGGGASSSSALTCLAGYAVRLANNVSIDRYELAMSSSRAEWFIGTRGGALDHLAICLSQSNHALHISYRDSAVTPLALPSSGYRWVTLFAHSAEKGSGVLLEYNERAVVARIIIPAIIADWSASNLDVAEQWRASVARLNDNDDSALLAIENCLSSLPETLSLAGLERFDRQSYENCVQSFPLLVKERKERPLKIRARAEHHLGEIRRTRSAYTLLSTCDNEASEGRESSQAAAMIKLGALLNETHESLRDLYEVSTPQIELLRDNILKCAGVLGARIMGGGFGGNILALVKEEDVVEVVKAATKSYEGLGRADAAEAIRVSSPGNAINVLPSIDPNEEIRSYNVKFAALDFRPDGSILNKSTGDVAVSGTALLQVANADRAQINGLLDATDAGNICRELQPIIVAAGNGTRAYASGLEVPKAIAPILGVPTIARVYDEVIRACPGCRTPIVLVSDEVRPHAVKALGDRPHMIVVQTIARGTGDAVLYTEDLLRGHDGYTLVVWGTQPVIRGETYRRTLSLGSLHSEYDMIVPTAFKEKPYAPLWRTKEGDVSQAVETHLQKADTVLFGEDNLGLFLLKTDAMFRVLKSVRSISFDEITGKYDRIGGELGFPNELISGLALSNCGVFASPIGDWREAQGIKALKDLDTCERFIADLSE